MGLLATVISLAVLAKKNQYLPRTDPGRHVSKVSKMVQGQREASVDQDLFNDTPKCGIPIPIETSPAYIGLSALPHSLAIVLSTGQLRSPPHIHTS